MIEKHASSIHTRCHRFVVEQSSVSKYRGAALTSSRRFGTLIIPSGVIFQSTTQARSMFSIAGRKIEAGDEVRLSYVIIEMADLTSPYEVTVIWPVAEFY